MIEGRCATPGSRRLTARPAPHPGRRQACPATFEGAPHENRLDQDSACRSAARRGGVGRLRAHGPGTVAVDRFDYSTAIADSWKQQTLLNIVKMGYRCHGLQVPRVTGATCHEHHNLGY